MDQKLREAGSALLPYFALFLVAIAAYVFFFNTQYGYYDSSLWQWAFLGIGLAVIIALLFGKTSQKTSSIGFYNALPWMLIVCVLISVAAIITWPKETLDSFQMAYIIGTVIFAVLLLFYAIKRISTIAESAVAILLGVFLILVLPELFDFINPQENPNFDLINKIPNTLVLAGCILFVVGTCVLLKNISKRDYVECAKYGFATGFLIVAFLEIYGIFSFLSFGITFFDATMFITPLVQSLSLGAITATFAVSLKYFGKQKTV